MNIDTRRLGTFAFLLFFISGCFSGCLANAVVPNAPFSHVEWQNCDQYIKKHKSALFSDKTAAIFQKKELPCSITIDQRKKELYLNLKGRKGAFIGQGCNKIITKSIRYGKNPRLVARCEGDLTVLEEGRILSLFQGIPGIVQIYSTIQCSDNRSEIMIEYFNSGSLKDLQKKKEIIPEASLLNITQDLLTGLKAIHHKGYYHRDLHRGNILISHHKNTMKAAIADFGLAMAIDQEPTAKIAVPDSSCPPETILTDLCKIDRKKSESYSMGVILHILLFKTMPKWSRLIRQSQLPQMSLEEKERLYHTITRLYTKSSRSVMTKPARTIREKLSFLTFQMLHPNPTNRVEVEEALNYVLSL